MILLSSKTKTEMGSATVPVAAFGVRAERIFSPLPPCKSIRNTQNALASWTAVAATPLLPDGSNNSVAPDPLNQIKAN